ncbi:MAG: hypothetical protein WAM60_25410 [Candidatus Promineifilaceae bacterium]
MAEKRQIMPVPAKKQAPEELKQQLVQAQQALLEAESELAKEQAAVNAFRMHCRLKLDRLVDAFQEIQFEKQSCLTRWRLLVQEQETLSHEEGDSFWEAAAIDEDILAEKEEEVLLPTDTPRDKAAEKRLYRELARRFHPDLAETAVEQAYRTSVMAAVNTAYAANDIQALYDMAEELDPGELAELATIESVQNRKLRERILKLRRRRRKAVQRLKALRQENSARLWRKAQSLTSEDENWWDSVRLELERAIQRREEEIALIKNKIAVLEAEEAS